MLNAIYCSPLIFFSLLWLANLFLKKGFSKIESQYYSPFTPVEHVKVRSFLLFFQQLKLLSSCSPLITADPSFWPVLQKFLQNTFAISILSLCHYTQLVFFTLQALHKSIQIHCLVSSPPSPIYFFALADSPRIAVLPTFL